MPVIDATEGKSAMTKRISDDNVELAWRKAGPMSGRDPALYRIAPDVIRSVIRRDQYDIRGEYGWRIECGIPVAYRTASTESAIRALEFESVSAKSHPSARRGYSQG